MPEERRLVTVLFADVSGSTALGEEMDPEDVRALLGRYYAVAKEVVPAHGGTVEKFIGDAVMAVFGLARAHGDDARRALDAALSLRDQVRADPLLGERLPIRIGVNTGEVVASREREDGDFLVTGDAVNVAARIQQLGDPWAILCGERTARAAGEAFVFGTPVALEARGKRRPVTALPLLGRAAGVRLPPVPLLGRDEDLAQLELVASRAFKEQRPFLVSLIAPAGTGKTRLLEEFLDRLPARAPGARVAIAQCLPYGQRLTYWPLRGILYGLAGIPDDARPAAVRERILGWLRDAGLAEPETTAALLATTIGASESEAPDRSALFAAWRSAIEVAARGAPHVIVFEDLHWSSDSLLDLVEFVMQPRTAAPVLMIALTRPELLDRRPNWGGGRRNHLALSLEPLGDRAVAGIVTHLLESLRPELVAKIVERAEGNPFFAGELVRSLMDRMAPQADAAAVEAALASLPDTVQGTILARLDLLQPVERRALQVGAVLGRTFRAAGIAALDPHLPDPAAACETLVEKEVVRPSGADGFTFRHILIREVAYQTLPRSERARLHADAAAWLERSAEGREDAFAELVAYHYREAAGLSSALESGAAVDRVRGAAVRWLRRAADVASASAALGEAARHVRSAIELADREQQPELYQKLGEVASSGEEIVGSFRRAWELHQELGDGPDLELTALASMLMVYMRSPGAVGRRPDRATLDALRREAEALAARATDERAVARFLIADGFYPFWLSDQGATREEIRAGRSSAERGLVIAERLDDARLQSAALDAIASAPAMLGDWREAGEINRRRLRLQERLDLTERIDAYSMVVWAGAITGDLAEAAEVSRAGLAILQPGQVAGWALHLTSWRAYVTALLGDWDEALAMGDRSDLLWNEIGRPTTGYAVRGFIAALDVAHARGDDRRADVYAEAIRQIAAGFSDESTPRRLGAFAGRDIAASVRALRDSIPVAQLAGTWIRDELFERLFARAADVRHPIDPEFVGTVLDHAVRFRSRPAEAQARRALGVSRGDSGEMRAALAIFDDIGAVPYAARARCEIGLLEGDERAFLEGARVLERLGDQRQLGRYEERRRGG